MNINVNVKSAFKTSFGAECFTEQLMAYLSVIVKGIRYVMIDFTMSREADGLSELLSVMQR